MELQVGELSVENYKKLGFRDLEQLYMRKIIPYLNKSLETAFTLLESKPEGKDIPGQHIVAGILAREFLLAYNNYSAKEITLFSALRARQTDKVLIDIPQLVESHQHMLHLLEQIDKLSEQCTNSQSCSPLHKLGYAHINNLRQDVSRLFFLEEEYLFPRLPLLIPGK